MSTGRVTLIGGTGFVGRHLITRLTERFADVRVLTRRAQRVRELRVLPNVRVHEVRVHDPAALASAVAGSDCVINLVGILNQSGGSSSASFSAAHDELTASIVKACQAQGVKRYLQMSALGADADNGSSEYLRSKGRAEAHVMASDGIAWTIFRPSVIFGQGDAFFNRFAGLLAVMPVFPLACPEARFSPVFIGDVVAVMAASIDDASTHGQALTLCGPDDYTLRELVEYTGKTCGHPRPIIGLPNWAARLQARSLELVPGKPFSRDNYDSLQTPNVCPDGVERQPTSIDAVVPRYIGQQESNARLQSSRRIAGR